MTYVTPTYLRKKGQNALLDLLGGFPAPACRENAGWLM